MPRKCQDMALLARTSPLLLSGFRSYLNRPFCSAPFSDPLPRLSAREPRAKQASRRNHRGKYAKMPHFHRHYETAVTRHYLTVIVRLAFDTRIDAHNYHRPIKPMIAVDSSSFLS